MTFKKSDIPLSSIVFGFGTTSNPNGFSGVQVDSGFKSSSNPLYFVPINNTFMPFAGLKLEGFTKNSVDLLAENSFATVNRFITSNVVRLLRSAVSSSKVDVYYRGNADASKRSPTSMGILTVGEVVLDCPPVICVALQGAGGRGGNGFDSDVVLRYNSAGGGGGGSGATSLLTIAMPWNADSNVLVFQYKFDDGNVSLFSPNRSNAVIVCGKGGNGGNASADVWANWFSPGVGGSGGSLSYSFSDSIWNEGVQVAKFLLGSSTTSAVATFGRSGVRGGYGAADIGAIGISIRREPGSLGSSFDGNVYLNNSGLCLPYVGLGGGTGQGNFGGGGAGSLFGRGGHGFDNYPSNAAHGYGAGGGGGKPRNANKTGGNGSTACIQFFW